MVNRRHFVLAGAVLAGGAGLPGAAFAAPKQKIIYGGTVTRAQVMARAYDWLTRRVRYSQDNGRPVWDVNRGRRYRPDCSGFVCMALAIDPRDPRYGRALVTWELPRVCTPIEWSELLPGDILLHVNPKRRGNDHVRLFEVWLDAAKTRATVVEASSKAGAMTRKTVTVDPLYRPFRYRHIV